MQQWGLTMIWESCAREQVMWVTLLLKAIKYIHSTYIDFGSDMSCKVCFVMNDS